ncbi:MAG: hypothetical protein HXX10_07460 [Rhodoplanes sp.]|uniref:hypothetical protein n=1 Tax=Rhodoplanes sp. TaxID=1968906 RepID=UPI0017E6659C|nr:hypothetical protein [Rhodoplanes sp.]NVO13857.1 hypothetical protein [Rhodoplanes sp.]
MTPFRNGDTVTITATIVNAIPDNEGDLRLGSEHGPTLFAKPEVLTLVKRRALQAGDSVLYAGVFPGALLAIHEHAAWVDILGPGLITCQLDELSYAS